MIILIIKSYLSLLIPIGIGSLLIFIVGLYFILRKSPQTSRISSNENVIPFPTSSETITASHFSAIAGDDVLATQLDLARAFIEADKKHAAKNILQSVASEGTSAQQEEAKVLLSYL